MFLIVLTRKTESIKSIIAIISGICSVLSHVTCPENFKRVDYNDKNSVRKVVEHNLVAVKNLQQL